jgi:hypothetical protein
MSHMRRNPQSDGWREWTISNRDPPSPRPTGTGVIRLLLAIAVAAFVLILPITKPNLGTRLRQMWRGLSPALLSMDGGVADNAHDRSYRLLRREAE